VLPRAELDLHGTLLGGQSFRWRAAASASAATGGELLNGEALPVWRTVMAKQLVQVWREGERLAAAMNPGPFDAGLLHQYFDLNHSVEEILAAWTGDEHLQAAAVRYPGLRILQQDPWETLIAFILSQNSNVPRITGNIASLCREYGDEITAGWHSFPDPVQLARASVEDLRAMGLGYRAEYVFAAARRCSDIGVQWLHALASVPYSEARDCLTLGGDHWGKVSGVGPKVADCILLFSLRHYDAFPVDVHVRRAMERWYGAEAQFTSRYDSVAEFGRARFGRYAGYAQQYLFHRERAG